MDKIQFNADIELTNEQMLDIEDQISEKAGRDREVVNWSVKTRYEVTFMLAEKAEIKK